jgi:hypothetical protein
LPPVALELDAEYGQTGRMTSPTSVACLKVTLDDVEPAVVRRLEVPVDLRLDRFHLVLQAALGWTNSHLWEFRARDVGWGIPDPEWDRGSRPLARCSLIRQIGFVNLRECPGGTSDQAQLPEPSS